MLRRYRFYLSHTIVEASGTDRVTGVTIAQVDSHFNFIEGTEKTFDVDTICVAVGLSPMSQLLKQAGVKMKDTPGGYVPECDEWGRTSVPGIFAAGDVSGIEEASSAMIEGRIAGSVISQDLGFIDKSEMEARASELEDALGSLREGMFAPKNRGKLIEKTEEGIDVSMNLLEHGFVADDEIERYPGVTHRNTSGYRVHPEHPVQPVPGCVSKGVHKHRGKYNLSSDSDGKSMYRMWHVRCKLFRTGHIPGGRGHRGWLWNGDTSI